MTHLGLVSFAVELFHSPVSWWMGHSSMFWWFYRKSILTFPRSKKKIKKKRILRLISDGPGLFLCHMHMPILHNVCIGDWGEITVFIERIEELWPINLSPINNQKNRKEINEKFSERNCSFDLHIYYIHLQSTDPHFLLLTNYIETWKHTQYTCYYYRTVIIIISTFVCSSLAVWMWCKIHLLFFFFFNLLRRLRIELCNGVSNFPENAL